MKAISIASGLLAVFLSVAIGAVAVASLPPDVAGYLAKVAKFTPAEIAAIESGRVVAHVDPGVNDTEMLAVAAVKIRSTRAQVISYYGQMVSWVDGSVTLGFGRFSTPPALADVKSLVLDKDELEALRTCRPANCDIRVGLAGADAIQRAVNWKAPDAAEQAQRFVRAALVEYMAAYQSRGDAALITYNDTAKPVSLADQWRSIVASSPYFHQYQPELRNYLTGFPAAKLPGGRDIFYWVKENFGLKPTISLVHAVVYEAANQPDRTTIIQKQIYASHYLLGSLTAGSVISSTENGQPVSYLVYATRTRGDMLKGGFGGLKRTLARDQARKAAEQTLETIQVTLEKAAGVRR